MRRRWATSNPICMTPLGYGFTAAMIEWPFDNGQTEKSGHRMAAEGMQFPWRLDRHTISANLELIWEMSAQGPVHCLSSTSGAMFIERGCAAANEQWRRKVRLAALHAVVLALLVLIAVPPATAAPDAPITFSVKKSKLAMSASNPLAIGKGPDEVISVTLQGVLYDPPLTVRPAAKDGIDRTGIEGALAADHGANLAADLDWMAAGFAAEERAGLRAFFASDPSLMAQNQAAVKGIERFLLEGVVRHGGYRLALVIEEHGGRAYRRIYAFVSDPEGWLRTNALSSEPVFDVVFSAAIGGTIRRKDE